MSNVTNDNDQIYYFLYSEEMVKEKNAILARQNKFFQPGSVVVNGESKQYTYLSKNESIPRFIDTKIVASGRKEDFKYTEPKNMIRKGTSL